MRTAIALYLFLFAAYFDLHAQYPILSPYAISLGAAPAFIGFIMGMYSLTHLPGNLLAGRWVDRYGSKKFIIGSLFGAGILLLLQAYAASPWSLLVIRTISGFVLAFLSPACLSLLAKLARDTVHQGKLMAGNGFVHTIAAVISPAAGAVLVNHVGYQHAFSILGWLLVAVSLSGFVLIKEASPSTSNQRIETASMHPARELEEPVLPWLFYLLPFALSCSLGILFFEIPLIPAAAGSLWATSMLFTVVSIGSLSTLSMLFLHRFTPMSRIMIGGLALAICLYFLSPNYGIPLPALLFLIGAAKGVIYPAMATQLTLLSSADKYGRAFSVLSIAFSLGSFAGPMLAGQLRDELSSYFIGFLVLMAALTLFPFVQQNKFRASSTFPGQL